VSEGARERILARVRTALGRMPGEGAPEPPAYELVVRGPGAGAERVRLFAERFEALAGKAHVVGSAAEAGAKAREIVAGRSVVAVEHEVVRAAGVMEWDGDVRHGFATGEELRRACAECAVGITSTSYALADTGTLVTMAGPGEPRLASLLPPVHVALVPAGVILAGIEELLLRVPEPDEGTSSMVFITGPSRTADIEQILVRGVHGPGEIHAIVIV
jgi:L-lactate dehydrogenase complex protein LldG